MRIGGEKSPKLARSCKPKKKRRGQPSPEDVVESQSEILSLTRLAEKKRRRKAGLKERVPYCVKSRKRNQNK